MDAKVALGQGGGLFRAQARLEAELAYGLPLGGTGLFAPYTGLGLLGKGERRKSTPTILEPGYDHRVLLEGQLRF